MTTLLLVAVTLGVFYPVLRQEFVPWDDDILVYENPYLEAVTPSKILHFWRQPYQKLYTPVTYSLYALLAPMAQAPQPLTTPGGGQSTLDPRVFHLANLVLHILNVLLVFAILRLLIGHEGAAAGGALLFGIHPVQVETVAWISELKGVLSGFFSLLALWQYLRYALAHREGLPLRRQRWHYALAVIAFILALLSKPSAVAVPLIAWALDYWAVQRPTRTATRALAGWIALAALWIVVSRFAQPTPNIRIPLWWRPFVAGDALAFYLVKLALPLHLGPHYSRTPSFVMQHTWSYWSWIVPVVFAIVVWRRRQSRPWLMAALGVFVAAVLPVLGFVPFIFQGHSTVADRYLYLALLGPAYGLAWLLRRPKKFASVLWAVVLLLYAWQTTRQVRYWRDGMTLFTHTLRINPRSWVAHNSLGNTLAGQGKSAEAIRHYRQAIEINPLETQALNNLGVALARQGQTTAAIEHFRTVLQIDPDDYMAYVNLANTLAQEGQLTDAVSYYEQALRLRPDSPAAHNNLGLALARQGELAQAITHYEEALRLQPTDAETHYNLGIAWGRQGKAQQAIQH
ncbi:MAG: tetratricopeptide repeat protein, partial [Armatimonadota bacterium]|nr:tetratricopeptide repeat protein [Armatimonadota bacterium]